MNWHFPPGFVRAHSVLPEDFREGPPDIADYPADATALSLGGRKRDESRGWELLPERKLVDTVVVFQPQARHLAWIARMPWLKRLGLMNPQTGDLSALAALENVEAFCIEDANSLLSLEFLRPLKRLRALSVFDAKRLGDLSGIEHLPQLEELALQRGIWNAMKVATLRPLAGLKSLRCLRLTAEAADDSLEPLKNLTALEELDLNLMYPLEQYAKLSVFLPADICEVFAQPYVTMREMCRKDPAHTVILPAKGHRRFCRDCQPSKLDAYLAEFHAFRAEAQRRGNF